MKTHVQQKLARSFILTALLASLVSFTGFAGGDVYEIYLNNKLVCRESYKQLTGSKELHLDKLNANDRLVIKYSHCGVTGQNRSIVVKDENDNIIKEWKFADTKNNQSAMQIPVKELLDLNAKNGSIRLFYSAKQMPEGRMLTAIKLDDKKVAMQNGRNAMRTYLTLAFGYFLSQLQLC